jgi:hypothetical protein
MLQQTRAQAVIPTTSASWSASPPWKPWRRRPKKKCWRCGAAWDTIRARATCGAPRGKWRQAGGFPREVRRAIRALPGVGDYTAAAMASIAFGLPRAVVDGNVLRVVARMENDSGDIAVAHARAFSRVARRRGWTRKRAGRLQPGAHGTGRHGVPAAESVVPGSARCACCAARQAGHRGAIAGEASQDRAGANRSCAPAGAQSAGASCCGSAPKTSCAPHGRFLGTALARSSCPARASARRSAQFRHTITHHHYTFTVKTAARAAEPSLRSAHYPLGGPPSRPMRIPLSTTARKALRLGELL